MKTLKIKSLFGIALLGLFTFFIITAIWPMNSFYVDEFESNSNVSLGENFKVLVKESSYPGFHGDYYSKAVFRINDLDFSNLSTDLEEILKCDIPNLVKPYLSKGNSFAKCWSVNRNLDEWFNLTYFEKSGILYFEFNQT